MKPWLDPLFDAAGMAEADRWAIEEGGIPSLDLMEVAGRAVADACLELAGGGSVLVVCGKGNNAGDGLVCARYLREAGIEVEVALLWPPDSLSPDSLTNFERLGGEGILEGPDAAGGAGEASVVVDAILGTGFAGEPREPVAGAIGTIVESGTPVIACDLPSGVNASTGEAGLAVPATRTVTFHGRKVGHLVNPGKRLAGQLEVVPIGIPPEAPPAMAAGVIRSDVLELLPRRTASSTKFSSGRVTVAGGSPGLTGAVILASRAAIRAGAGYATAAVPDSLEPIFESATPEVMTLGCQEDEAALGPDSLERLVDHTRDAAAVLIGSGMGRSEASRELLRAAVAEIEVPLVVDADALSLLAGDPGSVAGRTAPTVLTPHAGEMGRLLGIPPAEVEDHRLASVTRAVELSGATVVLKGDDTIVACGEGVAINDLSAPGLATAGTGDVLAGICAAFLARGLGPFEAASAAVFSHSVAGRIASERIGAAEGVIASDVIEAIPEALASRPDRGPGRGIDSS